MEVGLYREGLKIAHMRHWPKGGTKQGAPPGRRRQGQEAVEEKALSPFLIFSFGNL